MMGVYRVRNDTCAENPIVQVDQGVYTGELISSLNKEWRSITEEVFDNIIDRIIILNENQLKVRLKNGVEVDMAYGTEV